MTSSPTIPPGVYPCQLAAFAEPVPTPAPLRHRQPNNPLAAEAAIIRVLTPFPLPTQWEIVKTVLAWLRHAERRRIADGD